MSTQLDLKRVELKAYLSFHQDGILDFFCGLCLIGAALGIWTGNSAFAVILPSISILMVPIIKKSITQPRLGYVKFLPEREEKERKNKLALVLLLTLTTIIGVVVFFGYTGNSHWQRWIRDMALVPFGVVLAFIAAALWILYGIVRNLIYSILILFTFLTCHFLHLLPWVQFIIIGVILSLSGLILFILFVSKYPKSATEGSRDTQEKA